jgi:hypothetical protein
VPMVVALGESRRHDRIAESGCKVEIPADGGFAKVFALLTLSCSDITHTQTMVLHQTSDTAWPRQSRNKSAKCRYLSKLGYSGLFGCACARVGDPEWTHPARVLGMRCTPL